MRYLATCSALWQIHIIAAFFLLLTGVPLAHAADVNLVIDIIECESSGRHNVYGKEDGGESYGIAQFKETTFNEMKHLARMPRLHYKNPIHQLRLMVWMLDHGYGNRWTCYRKLTPPMDGRLR